MIKALAPRKRRGCSWVWLWLALGGLSQPPTVHAQKETKAAAVKNDAASSKDRVADKDGDREKDDARPGDDGPVAKKAGPVEAFKDPDAEAALAVFKSLPFRDCRDEDINAVKSMAAGQASTDRTTIQRFVEGMAFRLVDKGNINALINPPKNLNARARQFTAIKVATENLLDALNTARVVKNTGFLNTYNDVLVAVLPRLLDNNLISRLEAIIVLGQSGSAKAADVFIAQLKNPDQTVWVKHWAAHGFSNMADGGVRVDSVLPAAKAIEAAKAVSDFLNTKEDLPWPVRMRGLEAIGAMRQASVPSQQQKAELAATAMKALVDPDAKFEVRAAAAQALGMVRVNPNVAKYNFGLIAYGIGRLAAEIGEKINATYSDNPVQAEALTGLLAVQLYQAFNGMDGARESGLLHVPEGNPNFAPAQNAIKQIADRESSLARAALELVRGTRGQATEHKKNLANRVNEMKQYLERTTPKDFHLVPGGDEYRAGDSSALADTPPSKNKVAGGR